MDIIENSLRNSYPIIKISRGWFKGSTPLEIGYWMFPSFILILIGITIVIENNYNINSNLVKVGIFLIFALLPLILLYNGIFPAFFEFYPDRVVLNVNYKKKNELVLGRHISIGLSLKNPKIPVSPSNISGYSFIDLRIPNNYIIISDNFGWKSDDIHLLFEPFIFLARSGKCYIHERDPLNEYLNEQKML